MGDTQRSRTCTHTATPSLTWRQWNKQSRKRHENLSGAREMGTWCAKERERCFRRKRQMVSKLLRSPKAGPTSKLSSSRCALLRFPHFSFFFSFSLSLYLSLSHILTLSFAHSHWHYCFCGFSVNILHKISIWYANGRICENVRLQWLLRLYEI